MKAVLITSNNAYVPKAIPALEIFHRHNPDYVKYIMGSDITPDSIELCSRFGINVINVDLSEYFFDFDKRPTDCNYPIECLYHFYAYKALADYKYVVKLEADIITKKRLNEAYLKKTKYISGGLNPDIKFTQLKRLYCDLPRLKRAFKIRVNPKKDNRIIGGVVIYNVKNLHKIGFFEKIVDIYRKSREVGAPRWLDDGIMTFYQMIHPEHVKLFKKEFHVLYMQKYKPDIYKTGVFFHMGFNKYWNPKPLSSKHKVIRMINRDTIKFIGQNFSKEFVETHFPQLIPIIVGKYGMALVPAPN